MMFNFPRRARGVYANCYLFGFVKIRGQGRLRGGYGDSDFSAAVAL